MVSIQLLEKNWQCHFFGVARCTGYETSVSTGKFPSAWKVSTIVPIPKGKQSDKLANYRPVSVLPIVSKLIEKRERLTRGTFANTCSDITANSGALCHHVHQYQL